MSTEKVRVAIADDFPVIRKGVRAVLQRLPEVEVVGEAANGSEAVHLVRETSPDLLILDIQMPVLTGFDVLRLLQDQAADLVIIVLSGLEEPGIEELALSLGACYFLPKTDASRLVRLVREIITGRFHCEKIK